jgi:hypothetical protein
LTEGTWVQLGNLLLEIYQERMKLTNNLLNSPIRIVLNSPTITSEKTIDLPSTIEPNKEMEIAPNIEENLEKNTDNQKKEDNIDMELDTGATVEESNIPAVNTIDDNNEKNNATTDETIPSNAIESVEEEPPTSDVRDEAENSTIESSKTKDKDKHNTRHSSRQSDVILYCNWQRFICL